MISTALSVMIIDDDELMTKSLARSLKRLKEAIEVYVFNDPVKYKSEIDDLLPNIDLILCDSNMPMISGEDILRQVALINPDILRVIVSGDCKPEDRVPEYHIYIEKPFDKSSLIALLNYADRLSKLKADLNIPLRCLESLLINDIQLLNQIYNDESAESGSRSNTKSDVPTINQEFISTESYSLCLLCIKHILGDEKQIIRRFDEWIESSFKKEGLPKFKNNEKFVFLLCTAFLLDAQLIKGSEEYELASKGVFEISTLLFNRDFQPLQSTHTDWSILTIKAN